MINRIGKTGIILAIIAIGIAVFQDGIRESIDLTGSSEKVSVFKKGITIFSRDKPEIERDYIDYSYMGIGFLAMTLGVFSFLGKENHRVSGTAAALGLIAIAWHYVLIGIVLAVFIFFFTSLA